MGQTRSLHIASFILLAAFLLPSAIKLEHHHPAGKLTIDEHPHLATPHLHCAICDFELSAFEPGSPLSWGYREHSFSQFTEILSSLLIPSFLDYSGLLRAPPRELF